MKFIPFKSVGEFSFNSSIEDVKKKLHNQSIILGDRRELNRIYKSIFIPKRKIYIVFNETGSFIRTIELEEDVFLGTHNLFQMSINEIKDFLEKEDSLYSTDEENSIESKKYGFIISNNYKKNSILFYSEEYLEENEVSPQDIIKYYLV